MYQQFVKPILSRTQIMTALVLLFVSIAVPAADDRSEDELGQRVAMVRTLLFESSAALKITASSDEEAHQKRDQAIALFESGAGPGDKASREERLNAAVAMLYEAVAAVSTSTNSDEKDRRDFDNKQRSLEALLAAHKRIMAEKGMAARHAALSDETEAEMRAANQLLAEGKVHEARVFLDKAYEKTKLSVERSREGETLVRELKFETPEDEYLYELDRNDTHRMLLTVLLEEKMKSARIKERVASFITSADEFRATAVRHADAKQFEDATEELERSTSELVKAIRSAGVYIPG